MVLFNFSTNYNLKGDEFHNFLLNFDLFYELSLKLFYEKEFHETNVKTNCILEFPMYDVIGSR